MRIARVIKKHESENPVPLIMRINEILEGEQRETEWDGWLWCKNSGGVFGWIPEAYLKPLSEERMYVATRDYNARELTVDVGQEVMIFDEESSWAWARTSIGDEGWVPLESLENVAKSDSIPDMM